MKKIVAVLFCICACGCLKSFVPRGYNGVRAKKKFNVIPGRIQCELYDKGGEGVAYHDSDTVNNGSGKLNPANGDYYNEFRMAEGVDISYTKPGGIDDNPYNVVAPAMKQLYVGWTKPGEWLNYSVLVTKTGYYRISIMYTANGDGAISLDIDGKPLTTTLAIPSTHNDKDTVAWRQWHHWNRIEELTTVSVQKGAHLLTLHVVGNGNMNFDYLEFRQLAPLLMH